MFSFRAACLARNNRYQLSNWDYRKVGESIRKGVAAEAGLLEGRRIARHIGRGVYSVPFEATRGLKGDSKKILELAKKLIMR